MTSADPLRVALRNLGAACHDLLLRRSQTFPGLALQADEDRLETALRAPVDTRTRLDAAEAFVASAAGRLDAVRAHLDHLSAVIADLRQGGADEQHWPVVDEWSQSYAERSPPTAQLWHPNRSQRSPRLHLSQGPRLHQSQSRSPHQGPVESGTQLWRLHQSPDEWSQSYADQSQSQRSPPQSPVEGGTQLWRAPENERSQSPKEWASPVIGPVPSAGDWPLSSQSAPSLVPSSPEIGWLRSHSLSRSPSPAMRELASPHRSPSASPFAPGPEFEFDMQPQTNTALRLWSSPRSASPEVGTEDIAHMAHFFTRPRSPQPPPKRRAIESPSPGPETPTQPPGGFRNDAWFVEDSQGSDPSVTFT